MKPIRVALMLLAGSLMIGQPCHADPAKADPHAKKVNGDSPGDTAPLASGPTEKGALDEANFPPPGAATNGAGPNPNESGPVSADKANKK